jgi:predicted  nucleic acid-binding Zn-ribbon protein
MNDPLHDEKKDDEEITHNEEIIHNEEISHKTVWNDLAEKKDNVIEQMDKIYYELEDLQKVIDKCELDIEDYDSQIYNKKRPLTPQAEQALRERRQSAFDRCSASYDKTNALRKEFSDLNDSLTKIYEEMSTIKLASLKSFQDKNSILVDKVFSDPHLLSHISSFNSGFKKGGLSKRRKNKNKRKTRKHSVKK